MNKNLIGMMAAIMLVATGCQPAELKVADTPVTDTPVADSTEKNGETAEAVDYPNGDLRIIVPFATGGALDVQVRTVAKYLGKELGATIIVENKKGAGGIVGLSDYLKEDANTNTIILMDSFLLTGTPLFTKVQYSADDYLPIIDLKTIPYVLYTSPEKSGIQTFDELKQAGNVKFGSNGPGTFIYVGTETLLNQVGVKGSTITHDGNAVGIANMISGVTDVMFGTTIDKNVRTYVSDGTLVPLVFMGEEDYPADDVFTEGIPCAKTLGVDMEHYGFYYFAIRKGTNQAIVDKLYDAFQAVYANEEFKKEAEEQGILCEGKTGDEIMEFLNQMAESSKQYIQQ